MAPAGALSALAYLVFDKWHNWFLGAVVLFLYFWFVSAKIQGALENYFSFTKSLRIRLLAIFLSLATLGWFLFIFIFFNYFNGLAVFLSFFANALAWSIVNQSLPPLLGEGQREGYVAGEDTRTDTPPLAPPLKGEGDLEPPRPKIIVLVYLGLVIYGFYLLIQSKTNGIISSPWQTIDPRYIWVFLAATFLLGFLILFSKISLKTLLFFVIVHSFLLHSYLPLTHELFYGADGWRHVATENRLLNGKQVMIPEVVGERSVISKSNVGVLSYANFWGTNAVLSKILQIDLISLTKWLLPVLWSIIFTILLYEIGLALGWTGKRSLLFAWAGMWPFALQAGGSFSLPVNWGFLIFILLFLLLLKRTREPNDGQKNILLALGLGSALGYLLFFVLYWISYGIMLFLSYLSLRGAVATCLPAGRRGNPVVSTTKPWDCFALLAMTITTTLVLPALELVGRFSVWNSGVNILSQAKQFAGNLLSLYLANGPRPHDISGGNILFNQIPASIFTPNIFTQWLWWLPAAVLTAFVFIVLGIIKNRKDLIYKFILATFVILLTGYFLSFYLLAGEHLLARRLDAMLAFLFLILLFYGLDKITKNPTPRPSPYWGGDEDECCPLSPSPTRGGIKGGVLVLVVLSLAITASYTLGPDTYAVSGNQYNAANYVWSQEKDNVKYCVLGDTYSLLALEAVSEKQIIGGGFPISANFGQPEREALYKKMNIAINDELLNKAASLTSADHCWFVGEANNFTKQGILGNSIIFGDTAAVRYNIYNQQKTTNK